MISADVWTLFTRLLGLVYFIAFGSLYSQILGLSGSQGITPVSQVLEKIEQDFPRIAKYVYFPTLLWLGSSDRALRTLVALGLLGSVGVMIGGAWSPVF